MNKAGAVSLDSSFPLSRFLSPEIIEENLLECPICFLVLKDPFGASCSHICCLHCLKEWLDRDPSCPVCRLPIKRSDLKPLAGPLRNIYDSLKIKCDVEGCRDVIPLNSLQQHRTNVHKISSSTEKPNKPNNEIQNSTNIVTWQKVGDDWNVWTVSQLIKKLKDSQMSALSGRYVYVESPMGLTWCEGYSYVIQLYLHGYSRQSPSAVSVRVKFVKGAYDDHLKWPFSHKMVIKLLDVPGVQKEVSCPDGDISNQTTTPENDNPNRCTGYLELCSRQSLTTVRGDSLRLAVKFIPNKNEKRPIAVPGNHSRDLSANDSSSSALVRSSRSFSTFPSQNNEHPTITRQSHSPTITHETYWAPHISRPNVINGATPALLDMRRSRNISSSPHYRVPTAPPPTTLYPKPQPQPQPQPQPASPQVNISPKLRYARTPTYPTRPDVQPISPTWNTNAYPTRPAMNVAPRNTVTPRRTADRRPTRQI